ncbi:MAG: acetyl-CoA decarbonylase/synthase complex subunit delta [Candidatus Omnitrophica bacterium]|nr:acetyl-CoA decarbonylase/synthase complex subunit delta [Candidatus Omnitrophota bacterium]
MPIELVKEKCAGAINTVEIGRPDKAVKIGGQTALPFLFEEGEMPNPPLIAYEILDCAPDDWPEHLMEPYGSAIKDPVKWAKVCVNDFGAQVLCVRLASMHPDYGARKVEEPLAILKAISNQTGVPLIVMGSGDDERDNDIMPKVSQALKDENCLLGMAAQNNYKTLAATCLADGHSIIADSPIDVNIAKQVNILISDMGFDTKRIVMHPTTTSLGYGMEYVYSIMERARLAAFMGDRMLAMPFIVFVGAETWRTKEAKEFGKVQGINWEITTAVSLIQAGADLIVMRHPDAAKSVKNYIDRIMTK